MIAIVGGKGGCGKTTTALGLARALERAGRPTVAVDADRQVPNLHVLAGVDREPTLADVGEGRTVAEVAQAPDGTTELGVLPAAPAETEIDFPAALSRLREASVEVVVDCPSGLGPDVAEPLSVVDAAVLVTTGTDRSVSAATSTVDAARQLDVPVVGAVVTRTDGVPERVADTIDVPVVGAVPDVEEPLTAKRARNTYDEVAAELGGKSYGRGEEYTHKRMVGRLETGIDVLDRKLDGGLPPGCVVVYTASPASQSELLLYELTAARGTLYLTTERSDDVVRHAIESSMADVGSPTVRHLDDSSPLEEASRLVSALPDGANLIVDTMDVLERTDRREYLSFLNDLKQLMLDTGSIAILHCLKGPAEPENRATTEHVADAVFDLETSVGATEIENHLSIPKFRSGGAPTERIKLELSEEVAIDTSRDIA